MSQATDLIGLGVAAGVASLVSNGGVGSGNIAASGSTNLNCTQIGGQQYVTAVTSGSGGVCLPAVGGPTGCKLFDDFVVNNQQSAITLFLPTGVSISQQGSNIAGSVGISLGQHKSIACYPMTTTQWFGVLGN